MSLGKTFINRNITLKGFQPKIWPVIVMFLQNSNNIDKSVSHWLIALTKTARKITLQLLIKSCIYIAIQNQREWRQERKSAFNSRYYSGESRQSFFCLELHADEANGQCKENDPLASFMCQNR
mgnify:CR=1 FL=1